MAGGDVMLEGASPSLLDSAIEAIEKTGAEISTTNEGIRVRATARASRRSISPRAIPGFPTDCKPSSWP